MNAVVILPSLNPDEKMVDTVRRLLAEGFRDIVVVDDGSKEECKHFFAEADAYPEVTVLTHEVNRGKGRAMKTAFEYVLKNRRDVSGVVTVDGDGQHLPKDIRNCVKRMEELGDRVVLGVRDFSNPLVPPRSRFGNNLTRGIFRLFLGIRISDTQTGLRAIPFRYLEMMLTVEGERYEYETNQLIVLKKKGILLDEVVIETIYIDDNQSSHFHPIRDSLKIYGVIFRYLASSLLSFLIDIVLFTILNIFLGATSLGSKLRLFLATGGARTVSSFANYSMNRKLVFRSEGPMGRSLVRYYTLCVLQAFASYILVYLLAEQVLGLTEGILESAVKFLVDITLFFVSYQIQKHWVFKK